MIVVKRLLKRKLLLLVLMAVFFTAGAQNRSYISNHKIIAAVLAAQYGIPAPVILAVAAVESAGGNGPAARVLNNHFGIEGKNQYVNHKGHTSRYKQYDNVIASYIDFCKLITHKRFYHKLKGSANCLAWVKAISHAGYSEQPAQWEQKVMGVLATQQLRYSAKNTFATL